MLKDYKNKRNFAVTQEPNGEEKAENSKISGKNSGGKNSGRNSSDKYAENKIFSGKNSKRIFVVQHHLARADHYDFRLQWRGVLISFAVPKGPSFNPKDKRLAVHVEDHPLDYANFEGVIPKGQYGGGVVQVWDKGFFVPIGDFDKGLREGSVKFQLFGQRLQGRWALVRLKNDRLKNDRLKNDRLDDRLKNGQNDQNNKNSIKRKNLKNDQKIEQNEQKNWLLVKDRDEFALSTSGISKFRTSVLSGRTTAQIEKDEDVSRQKNPFSAVDVQLCRLVDRVPQGDEWIYELKYDGFRAVAFAEGGKVRILSRNQKDMTAHFREIADDLKEIAQGRAFVFDGEIVVLGENGRPNFQALQNHLRRGKKDATPQYVVFDLLALDGKDLREKPLLERKKQLENLLGVAEENANFYENNVKNSKKTLKNDKKIAKISKKFNKNDEKFNKNDKNFDNDNVLSNVTDNVAASAALGSCVSYGQHLEGNGQQFFDAVKKMQLEGVVAKKKFSTYQGVRTDDWVKIKCRPRAEFLVCGYVSSDKKDLSALVLGSYKNGKLVCVGRCGTGYDQKEAAELLKIFKKLRTDKCPFEKDEVPKIKNKIFWLKTPLVAEIEYAEITKDGILRQASFKGLRADKQPQEVVLEVPEKLELNLIENKKSEKSGQNLQKNLKKGAKNENSAQKTKKSSQQNTKNLLQSNVKKGNFSSEYLQRSEQQFLNKALSNLDLGPIEWQKEKQKILQNTAQKNLQNNFQNNLENFQDASIAGNVSKAKNISNAKNVSNTGNVSNANNVFYDVEISSPEKVLYKRPIITKGDVADYYFRAAQRMMPFVDGRLLSVVRCHKNLKECFYKKHPNTQIDGQETLIVENDEGERAPYFFLTSPQGLLGQVQLGTLEFHIWGSGAKTLEQPDYMVFDLDPDKNLGLDKVRQGAKDLKKILDQLHLKSFLKTSGGKGYHIVVPLQPVADWQTFHDFAQNVALLMESKWPQRYTTNIRKNTREGKIFVDFMRNTRGATSVAPYSLRAREGAKVSCPIFWSELDKIAPDDIDIFGALERLKKADPWKDFFAVKQSLK